MFSRTDKNGSRFELLEDVAGVIDAKAVTRGRREGRQFLVQQANAAADRLLHTAQQAQQCGFAATAGAFEEQGFAALQTEFGDVQQLRMAGPVEAQVRQFDQCLGHGLTHARLEIKRPGQARSLYRRVRSEFQRRVGCDHFCA